MTPNNFIQRSIINALSFIKDSVYADEYALKKGLMQQLDPRAKVFGIFLIIMLNMLLKSSFLILELYLLCLALVFASRINLLFFLKRTWFFIPLFAVLIAVPALFNVITPGTPLCTFNFIGVSCSITREGLSGAVLFVMRVVTSVSFVILLSLTTRHNELLKVLRIFKTPQVFIMTLGICYRYIFLFIEIIERTYTAIKSRAGFSVHHKTGRQIVTWNIANLWIKSYQLNNEVYSAMLSRGYTGEPKVLNDFRAKAVDWLWLGSVIIIFILSLRVK